MNYIEEKVEEFKRLFPCTYDQMSEDITTTHELFLRKALQEVDRRARANWLRSEIEKLEGEKVGEKDFFLRGDSKTTYEHAGRKFHNQALTSIITRYKEELKVLESK